MAGGIDGCLFGSHFIVSYRDLLEPIMLPEPSAAPAQRPIGKDVSNLRRAVQEALHRGANMKTAATEYFVVNGKFPNANVELSLPEPSIYRSTLLESLSVLSEGLIMAKLNPNAVAGGGTIYLKPVPSQAGDFVQWQSFSPDLEQITQIVEECAYLPKS